MTKPNVSYCEIILKNYSIFLLFCLEGSEQNILLMSKDHNGIIHCSQHRTVHFYVCMYEILFQIQCLFAGDFQVNHITSHYV